MREEYSPHAEALSSRTSTGVPDSLTRVSGRRKRRPSWAPPVDGGAGAEAGAGAAAGAAAEGRATATGPHETSGAPPFTAADQLVLAGTKVIDTLKEPLACPASAGVPSEAASTRPASTLENGVPPKGLAVILFTVSIMQPV